jgi:hypothetical protein
MENNQNVKDLMKDLDRFKSGEKNDASIQSNSHFLHKNACDAFGFRYRRVTRKASEEIKANTSSSFFGKKFDQCEQENTNVDVLMVNKLDTPLKQNDFIAIDAIPKQTRKDSFSRRQNSDKSIIEVKSIPAIKRGKSSLSNDDDELKFNEFARPLKPLNLSDASHYENINFNINSNAGYNKINRKRCESMKSLNSEEINFLFKGYLCDDSISCEANFKEKLQSGEYSNNFYQNVYSKYNGLDKELANKRKHVCLKLLNILKLIVK